MLYQSENGIKIDGESLSPLLIAHLLYRFVLRRPNSMVCNQNIEPPMTLDGCLHQLLRACSSGQIALHCRAMIVTALFGKLPGLRFGFVVVEDHLRSCCGEHADRCRTDT